MGFFQKTLTFVNLFGKVILKASQAGSNAPYASHVLDHFQNLYNWKAYLSVKYDGFFPENLPRAADFKEISEAINYHRAAKDPDRLIPLLIIKKNKLIKRIKKVQKEWMKLQ